MAARIAIIMTEQNGAMAQLRLWQLISPALPVGAFAYSQGLEYAIEAGWVRDQATCLDWIKGVAEHSLAQLDLPLLARCYHAWQVDDQAALRYWSQYIIAARESGELLAETRNLGKALAILLHDLGIAEASSWRNSSDCSFVLMFALGSVKWEIPLPDAMQGYLWTWCENQIAAAIKTIPLGQTAGQRLLSSLMRDIPRWRDSAMLCRDEEIGMICPGLAIASALHETQYSRLFRS